jgi:DNA polymerase-3 subunit alpha
MCNFGDDCLVNLHVHTAFSLLDGMQRIEDVVEKVKSLGQKAFAISEHGNVHSSVKAYKLAKENSLKFIYACEFYICSDRFEKDKSNKYYHLTILAKNEQGRQNINKLITISNLEGFYFKPRIDFNILSELSEGLIVMSGCMASELQQALAGGKIGNGDIEITSGNIERAKEIARRYRNVFGEDYYMEVQSHRDSRQQQLNRAIVDIAKDLGIQWVATADSHFTNEEDLDLHRVFIGINRNKDDFESDETYQDTHLQSEKDAWNLLLSLTENERNVAIRNTLIIADKCNAPLPLSAPLIPHVKVPEGFETEEAYLKELCNQGWKFRGIDKKSRKERQEYRDRLIYEYNAITEMGFTGYYLLVQGYATSVRRRGIARGSGGGSLVAYLLNIVDIDPLVHGLYFERFIDVAQLDLLKEGIITREELKIPDFDLDFGTKERDIVYNNIVEEHGFEHVVALGQFGYIWTKSAIKDVGRVLGVDFSVTNEITKLLGEDTIEEGLSSGLLKPYQRQYPKLFEYAQKLEGLPRSYGVHPCGKVVTIEPAVFYTGLSQKEGQLVLNIDMKDAELLGLVKVDLLGLRTVDVIYDTLDLIGQDTEYIRQIAYNNPEALKVFENGWTDGVFQFESEGMKNTMINMKPTHLDDLGVVNALYRPGSLKYIKNYIDRKFGREKFEYLHPDLEPILKVSYGIIVYQEQLIEVGRMAGMRNADLLRQATGKKDMKKLAKAEPELRDGLYKRGWSKEQVDQLWEDMLNFAKYSFNKAHSQAYAMIALICAFLKANHPTEFMCAWINSLSGHHDKIETAYKEAVRMGVNIKPLSFRNPSSLCKVENGELVYGISLIKHCNAQIAEDIMKLQPTDRFVDILIQIKESGTINSKQLDILIRLDFFSEYGKKERLLTILEEVNNGKNRYNKTHKEKTKLKRIEALYEFEDSLTNGQVSLYISPYEHIAFELDHYGFIKTTFDNISKPILAIMDIDMKPKSSYLVVKSFCYHTGATFEFRVKKDKFFGKKDIESFEIGDSIRTVKLEKKKRMRKDDATGEWLETGATDYYLEKAKKIKL